VSEGINHKFKDDDRVRIVGVDEGNPYFGKIGTITAVTRFKKRKELSYCVVSFRPEHKDLPANSFKLHMVELANAVTAIIPISERRTLIDVCWNAPNPTFFYPQINVDDQVYIIPTKDFGTVRWIESIDGHELYGVWDGHGLTRYTRHYLSLCLYYDGIMFMPIDCKPFHFGDPVKIEFYNGNRFGYFQQCKTPHWVTVKPADGGTLIETHLQRLSHAKPEEFPQPLTPDNPFNWGDTVEYKGQTAEFRVTAGGTGIIMLPSGLLQIPLKDLTLVKRTDKPGPPVKKSVAQSQDDWMAAPMRAILGPDPVHGLNDHGRFFPNKPAEPLPVTCTDCGQPVGRQVVMSNLKPYCADCGASHLKDEQDESLFAGLSDAPDEATPAPRVIEQPPQPEIPMKQLSLFGDM
jgi:hypothetical protein